MEVVFDNDLRWASLLGFQGLGEEEVTAVVEPDNGPLSAVRTPEERASGNPLRRIAVGEFIIQLHQGAALPVSVGHNQ